MTMISGTLYGIGFILVGIELTRRGKQAEQMEKTIIAQQTKIDTLTRELEEVKRKLEK